MRKRLKLSLLSVAAVAPTSAFVALTVSCGNTNGQPSSDELKYLDNVLSKDKWNTNSSMVPAPKTTIGKEFAEQKIRKTVSFSQFEPKSFLSDNSSSYGSIAGANVDSTIGLLVRRETMLKPIIEKLSRTEYAILRPSIWRYKLEYAEQVIVTTKDGVQHVFDNDNIDIYPEADGGEKDIVFGKESKKYPTYQKALYQGLSKDPKSINSKEFKETLERAKKLQVTVKENKKWFDKDGNETPYEVVPEDFYISWMRTALLGQVARAKYLTGVMSENEMKALDAKLNSLLETGSKYYTNKTKFPNEYLYKIFNINSKNFYDESKFITNVTVGDKTRKAVTFDILTETTNASFGEVFDSLGSDYVFSAAPSQYIKANENNPKIKPFVEDKDNSLQTVIEKIKALPNDNIVKRAGIYWYGINWEDTLYAGRYIYKGYNSSSQEEIVELNDKYFEPARPNAVKKAVRRFQGNADTQAFKTSVWEDYKKGQIAVINPVELLETDRNEALKEGSNYGLTYNQRINNKDSVYLLLPQIMPKSSRSNDLNVSNFEFYNDAYSLLNWGLTRQQIIDGTTSGEDVLVKIISGNGLSFRTILASSINWSSLNQQVWNGERKSWINGYAPNVKLGGTNGDKEAKDFETIINSSFAIDKDGNKVVFKNLNNSTVITDENNTQTSLDITNDAERIKSAGYESLQTAMTELLDKFYAENPSLQNEKVKFTYAFVFQKYNPSSYESIFTNLKKSFEGLDKKGRLEVTVKAAQNETLQKKLFLSETAIGPYFVSLWGYDVNQISSGINGFFNADLFSTLIAIGVSEKIQTQLSKSFPGFVELAKEFVKFAKENPVLFTVTLPFEKIINANLKQLDDINSHYGQYTFNKETNTIVKNNEEAENTDLASIAQTFLSNYLMKKTNEEIAKISAEISTFITPVVDTRRNVSAFGFTDLLVNPYISRPYLENNVLWLSDVSFYNVNENSGK